MARSSHFGNAECRTRNIEGSNIRSSLKPEPRWAVCQRVIQLKPKLGMSSQRRMTRWTRSSWVLARSHSRTWKKSMLTPAAINRTVLKSLLQNDLRRCPPIPRSMRHLPFLGHWRAGSNPALPQRPAGRSVRLVDPMSPLPPGYNHQVAVGIAAHRLWEPLMPAAADARYAAFLLRVIRADRSTAASRSRSPRGLRVRQL